MNIKLLFLLFVSTLLIGCQAPPVTLVTATLVPTSAPGGISTGATSAAATAVPATAPAAPTSTTVPAVTLAPIATLRPPTANPTINLRTVNWNQFLSTTPDLEHLSPPTPDPNRGPYVRVKGSSPQNPVQGFAVTDGILYLSFSDDGQEEAVISLNSGGTAGNLGLLIYRGGASAPVLVAALGGYKIGAIADGNRLLVREPVYAGWEPNCCPSGLSETHYRLQGNQLVKLDVVVQGIPQNRSLTVDHFYQLLSEKKYREAYAMTSPAYQAAQPFASWQAGYQNTLSFTYQVADGPDGSIAVDLVATDQTASGPVTQHFKGSWTLVWSDQAKGWLLDRAQMSLVP